MIYIDNISIWSNSMVESMKYIQLILEKLKEVEISASIKKSILYTDEIHFLSHTMSFCGL